jgi:DNA-binding transcriptional LysR family regulator
LSAQIRQLERRLKTQLLDRTTHVVTLTDAGRALQAHGPAALAALEQAWDAARRAGRGDTGNEPGPPTRDWGAMFAALEPDRAAA